MKRCIRCERMKEIYFFNKNKKTVDGRSKTCKACTEDSRRETKELINGEGNYIYKEITK